MNNDDILQKWAEIEQQYGLPAGWLSQTAQIESGGRAGSHNEFSGADGYFQFIPSTAKQYGLRYGKDTRDPIKSAIAAAQLAANNAQSIRDRLGREPTGGELYLAHQQGAGGANALLANPNAPAGRVVGFQAVRQNAGNPYAPASQFAQKWEAPYAGMGPMQTPSTVDPSVYGTKDDPLMQEFGGAPVEEAPSAVNPKVYGTKDDPLMQEFSEPANQTASREETAPAVQQMTPNQRVMETFEPEGKSKEGDAPYLPLPRGEAQQHFANLMEGIRENPTSPISISNMMALGMMGTGSPRVAALTAKLGPTLAKLLSGVAQGQGIAIGATHNIPGATALLRMMGVE